MRVVTNDYLLQFEGYDVPLTPINEDELELYLSFESITEPDATQDKQDIAASVTQKLGTAFKENAGE